MITIKNYKEDDIRYIIENYNNYTVKELANHLNKTEGSISNAVRKLGLKKQPHTSWSEQELSYLKDNYLLKSSEEIASHLNKTVNSVNAKCAVLNLVKHKNWTDEEIVFLKNNYLTMTHLAIGNTLNRSEQSIRVKCFELGLYKKSPPWTDDDIKFLNNNYLFLSNDELSEILGRSKDAISLKAKKSGLKKSPYHCDYHYFDNIDTEEKAYWLGFLTADGWAYFNEKSGAGMTGIELQYGDINHLKKFNKSISGNYKITDRWRPCLISTHPEKLNHVCCVRVFSALMCQSLMKYGFGGEKSHVAFIPELDNDLYRHYVRGFFDGDGCFSLSNQRLGVSFITASERLANDLSDILAQNDIYIHTYKSENEYGTMMYRLEATNKATKLKLLHFMYDDSLIYLDRKYKKFQKAIQKHETAIRHTS